MFGHNLWKAAGGPGLQQSFRTFRKGHNRLIYLQTRSVRHFSLPSHCLETSADLL